MLEYVYDPQKSYDKARRPRGIYLIRICIKAKDADIEPRFLTRFKKCLWLLKYVSDWFVTHQQMKIWDDNDDYCNGDRLIGWGKSYQKCKAQKVSIKEELLPTAWHPSRHWD